jgi:hypothetical protein
MNLRHQWASVFSFTALADFLGRVVDSMSHIAHQQGENT